VTIVSHARTNSNHCAVAVYKTLDHQTGIEAATAFPTFGTSLLEKGVFGNSYSSPRGDPRVAKACFGNGQWQARDQQCARINAGRIPQDVAGVVHLSD
jgi:hypothetical protein